MVRAYVAIITGEGAADDIVSAVRDLPGVAEAHVVAGDFDVVAEAEGETVRDLQRTVTDGIHGVEGVGTTRTYVQLD
ncbi:Lrp/AsnC ligand binding domain-containing protein [Halorussus salilacus]|uniref:Lrp/AsnC family transcriptional regulator n=1 Tax=Halorussus salilacus TaxID=2953750 RepID=UPI00209E4C73|nr:Lrp/AsnC ligand binding domain-containing protein [Halorussus salilacus]USZ67611.1 Lrp/AsnC ligand binding domain-containing protein [Halorussus salilacus]